MAVDRPEPPRGSCGPAFDQRVEEVIRRRLGYSESVDAESGLKGLLIVCGLTIAIVFTSLLVSLLAIITLVWIGKQYANWLFGGA